MSTARTPSQAPDNPAVQLTVTLRDVEPPVWRRVLVPSSLTLRELHDVIQTAMGWRDSHLHLFDIEGVVYSDDDDASDQALRDEEAFTVGEAAKVTESFTYEYDFGDSWQHEVRIEQIVPTGGVIPHLIGGARACPPEDCGGPWGYQQLLEILADPSDEEYQEMRAWVGDDLDPEAFDLTATNASLALLGRRTRRRRRGARRSVP